jgi:hypothetical protein
MGTNRFTIAGLMGVVVVAAVGMVGLKEGTALWAGIACTLTLLLLLGAVASATFAKGRGRAAAGGFAIFGLAYLALAFNAWSGWSTGLTFLLTDRLLDELHPLIHPQQVAAGNALLVQLNSGSWGGGMQSYRQVGHSLGALLFAVLGAFWARRVFIQYHEPPDRAAGR